MYNINDQLSEPFSPRINAKQMASPRIIVNNDADLESTDGTPLYNVGDLAMVRDDESKEWLVGCVTKSNPFIEVTPEGWDSSYRWKYIKPAQTKSNACLYSLVFSLLVLAAIAVTGLIFYTHFSNEIQVGSIYHGIKNDEKILITSKFQVCNWRKVSTSMVLLDDILVDGQAVASQEIMNGEEMIEGEVCSTGERVLLVASESGVSGSYVVDGVEHSLISQTSKTSFDEVDDYPIPDKVSADQLNDWELMVKKRVEAYEEKHKDDISGRRKLLTPGEVDVHVHFDIDGPMIEKLGSAYAATRYVVEMMALLNEVYYPLGFELKVYSVKIRSGYLSSTRSTGAYLSALRSVSRPANAHLIHSVSTRGLGGGIAYLYGLYSNYWNLGVSGIGGRYSKWDKYVLAHEIGHNFGLSHTHEVSPPIDRCGIDCSDRTGTIMSYCHTCGGMNAIQWKFHSRQEAHMLSAYESEKQWMARVNQCSAVSIQPQDGIAFFFAPDTSRCLEASIGNYDTGDCLSDQRWMIHHDGTIRFNKDDSKCLTATDCGGQAVIDSCNGAKKQKFSKTGSVWVNEKCGNLVAKGNTLGFGSGTAITHWCLENEQDPMLSCELFPEKISCGETITGTTSHNCNKLAGAAKDELVRFTAKRTGTHTFDACKSSFQVKLSIYNELMSGVIGGLSYSGHSQGCNAGSKAQMKVHLTAGKNYFLVVEGANSGNQGNYELTVWCPNMADCGNMDRCTSTSQCPVSHKYIELHTEMWVGNVCREKVGDMASWDCPGGCSKTANSPFCANTCQCKQDSDCSVGASCVDQKCQSDCENFEDVLSLGGNSGKKSCGEWFWNTANGDVNQCLTNFAMQNCPQTCCRESGSFTASPTKTPTVAPTSPTVSPVTSKPSTQPTKNPSTSNPTKSPTYDCSMMADHWGASNCKQWWDNKWGTCYDTVGWAAYWCGLTCCRQVGPPEGVATKSPTSKPSSEPTMEPTSLPTSVPVTTKPSTSPFTTKPSTSPTTSAPSKNPLTSSPSKPPTSNPLTSVPTRNPTTPIPTDAPVTPEPTLSPSTMKPTNTPLTATPTESPTTQPTQIPVTAIPSTSPTTSEPTISDECVAAGLIDHWGNSNCQNWWNQKWGECYDDHGWASYWCGMTCCRQVGPPVTKKPTFSPTPVPTNHPVTTTTEKPTTNPTTLPTSKTTTSKPLTTQAPKCNFSNGVSRDVCVSHQSAWKMCESGQDWWVNWACAEFCKC